MPYVVHTIGAIGAPDCSTFPPDPACFLGPLGPMVAPGAPPLVTPPAGGGASAPPFFGVPFAVGAGIGVVLGLGVALLVRR